MFGSLFAGNYKQAFAEEDKKKDPSPLPESILTPKYKAWAKS